MSFLKNMEIMNRNNWVHCIFQDSPFEINRLVLKKKELLSLQTLVNSYDPNPVLF